jgi:hypothetical protein
MFQKWGVYMKTVFPIGSIILLEWVLFEILAFIVGTIQSDPQMAA